MAGPQRQGETGQAMMAHAKHSSHQGQSRPVKTGRSEQDKIRDLSGLVRPDRSRIMASLKIWSHWGRNNMSVSADTPIPTRFHS